MKRLTLVRHAKSSWKDAGLADFERIASAIDYPAEKIVFEAGLYEASPDELLAVIHALPAGLEHVAVVAHNPGLTELHNRLADRRIDNIPTAGVVQLELSVGEWKQVRAGCARLLAFDHPKKH